MTFPGLSPQHRHCRFRGAAFLERSPKFCLVRSSLAVRDCVRSLGRSGTKPGNLRRRNACPVGAERARRRTAEANSRGEWPRRMAEANGRGEWPRRMAEANGRGEWPRPSWGRTNERTKRVGGRRGVGLLQFQARTASLSILERTSQVRFGFAPAARTPRGKFMAPAQPLRDKVAKPDQRSTERLQGRSFPAFSGIYAAQRPPAAAPRR